METLLTTLGFFGLTGLFIYRYIRKAEGDHPAPKPILTHPCPRCSHAVPRDSTFCPGCGIPQQIFDVVSAPAVEGEVSGSISRSHAVVRADLCVGCGTCAGACPEPGALTLHNKVAVVDQALCVGHGECVQACPVGAIVLGSGAAVHRVQVPDIGPDFQSNVPGLYVVGELGGRGLIKNAINEGKIAVECITRALGESERPADDDLLDLVVVGAGPAGLSAALEAHRAGLRYLLLEQGSLADTVRKYPRHKILFAEPLKVPLYGDLWIADASKESLLQVWETIVANTGLRVKTHHKVEAVTRDGDLFTVSGGGAGFRCRRVVLAMGRRGTPRRLDVKGEDLDKVFYDVAEMEAFQGRRVLVVGGGDSAIETVLGLANQPDTEVALSHRGAEFNRARERNQSRLKAAADQGRVRIYLESRVREILPDMVHLDVAGQDTILPNDTVIVRIGGEAPHAFLQRLGIRIIQKDLPLASDLARAG